MKNGVCRGARGGRPAAPWSLKTVAKRRSPRPCKKSPNSCLGLMSPNHARTGRKGEAVGYAGIDVSKDQLDVAVGTWGRGVERP